MVNQTCGACQRIETPSASNRDRLDLPGNWKTCAHVPVWTVITDRRPACEHFTPAQTRQR